MRYFEILKEETLEDAVQGNLTALLSMLKAKGVKQFPLKKLISGIKAGNVAIDPEDGETVDRIVDLLTSLEVVDKIQNDMVHIQYKDAPDYEPGPETEKKDEKEIDKKATKQAKDNLKDKDKGKDLDVKVDL